MLRILRVSDQNQSLPPPQILDLEIPFDFGPKSYKNLIDFYRILGPKSNGISKSKIWGGGKDQFWSETRRILSILYLLQTTLFLDKMEGLQQVQNAQNSTGLWLKVVLCPAPSYEFRFLSMFLLRRNINFNPTDSQWYILVIFLLRRNIKMSTIASQLYTLLCTLVQNHTKVQFYTNFGPFLGQNNKFCHIWGQILR